MTIIALMFIILLQFSLFFWRKTLMDGLSEMMMMNKTNSLGRETRRDQNFIRTWYMSYKRRGMLFQKGKDEAQKLDPLLIFSLHDSSSFSLSLFYLSLDDGYEKVLWISFLESRFFPTVHPSVLVMFYRGWNWTRFWFGGAETEDGEGEKVDDEDSRRDLEQRWEEGFWYSEMKDWNFNVERV